MRSETDERNLVVSITDEGERLKEKAVEIPTQIAGCTNLSQEEATELYTILYKIQWRNKNVTRFYLL